MRYIPPIFILTCCLFFYTCKKNTDTDTNTAPSEIYGKTDELNAQIRQGTVIDLAGDTYILDKPLNISSHNVTIKNGGLKRATTPYTFLSEPIDSGQTFIIVQKATQFGIGQWIKPLTGHAFNQNDRDNTVHNIKQISGDTMFFDEHWKRDMPMGVKIIRHGHIVRIDLDDARDIRFENIIFDGNVQGNAHTHDWRINPTINMRGDIVIENCTFINTPSENIFQCGGVVRNCEYYNLYGSFIHWSCRNGHQLSSLVEGNQGSKSNIATDDISGHSEGVLTFSANSYNITVRNNHFSDGAEPVMGHQGLDDYSISVTDNYFENFSRKIASISANHPDSLDMSNNVFVNVPE